MGRQGEGEGREREGPQVSVEPGPLGGLLRHCSSAFGHFLTRQKLR